MREGPDERLWQAPSGWVDTRVRQDCLRLAMTEALAYALDGNESLKRAFYQFSEPILSVETVVSTSIMGYDPSKARKLFLKLRLISPLFVRPMRDCWESSTLSCKPPMIVRGGRTPTFNSNLDPVLQFMVDRDLSGCKWCRVPLRSLDGPTRTYCDYETVCLFESMEVLQERDDLGCLRMLSFDLEAAGRRGVFPDPSVDPVIQISLHFSSEQEPILLSFKECEPIPGALVLSFEKEESLLLAFRDIVLHFDPDILTGYNICNFDMEYLQKRAEALAIGAEFALMTRLKPSSKRRGDRRGPEHMQVKELFFQSAQVGKRKSNRVSIRGRVVMDVYLWVLNNFRLEEYKLDAVCRVYLGADMTKEDLHFTEITPKWLEGPKGRKTLGIYCLKDAELPLELIKKLNILFNAVERARVMAIPLEYVLNRGALIRFTSQLMKECAAQNYLLPYVPEDSPLRHFGSKYAGATVLEVRRGLWRMVTTLDFSSMYPAIIVAHNLCYSTYGPLGRPCTRFEGHRFVSEQDRQGLIGLILKRMLHLRSVAKEQFQAEKDPLQQKVLKARELSIKLFNNGVYGGMGSRHALIPARFIAETTTGIGRRDIARIKEIAEAQFTVSKGYPSNAEVVCGDTDSIFVMMPTRAKEGAEALAEAIGMAEILVELINREMKPPKSIAFEKVFENLLIMKKKRSAAEWPPPALPCDACSAGTRAKSMRA